MSQNKLVNAKLYRRAALLSWVERDKVIRDYISRSGDTIDVDTLKGLFDFSNSMKMESIMISMGKSVVRSGSITLVNFLTKLGISIGMFIDPEHIDPHLDDDDLIALIEHQLDKLSDTKHKRKSLYFTIGAKMIGQMLNINLNRVSDSIFKHMEPSVIEKLSTVDFNTNEDNVILDVPKAREDFTETSVGDATFNLDADGDVDMATSNDTVYEVRYADDPQSYKGTVDDTFNGTVDGTVDGNGNVNANGNHRTTLETIEEEYGDNTNGNVEGRSRRVKRIDFDNDEKIKSLEKIGVNQNILGGFLPLHDTTDDDKLNSSSITTSVVNSDNTDEHVSGNVYDNTHVNVNANADINANANVNAPHSGPMSVVIPLKLDDLDVDSNGSGALPLHETTMTATVTELLPEHQSVPQDDLTSEYTPMSVDDDNEHVEEHTKLKLDVATGKNKSKGAKMDIKTDKLDNKTKPKKSVTFVDEILDAVTSSDFKPPEPWVDTDTTSVNDWLHKSLNSQDVSSNGSNGVESTPSTSTSPLPTLPSPKLGDLKEPKKRKHASGSVNGTSNVTSNGTSNGTLIKRKKTSSFPSTNTEFDLLSQIEKTSNKNSKSMNKIGGVKPLGTII